ncbi:ATPase [Azospirillum sp. RWY-5-1]|uniref:ATPase n=1 Tax=Azospirillum oleiclasticum TaxID=2735135 RepID=A0ABX2T2A0_9PROT|nr:ATP12 family protein [Azospirillum oleiclasticum]NYZ11193.1 ATPase [Azospirillum oleiclasticum]NYZ18354.1 ATPase [Azospirillum oleiclasticum]
MKRVYKTVTVQVADNDGFEVRLDGRSLRSPGKNGLSLPTWELAAAIAAEWDAQAVDVNPNTMPMMQLASTAVDLVAKSREAFVDGVAAYGGTDLLCYRADHPRELAERQAAQWQPLLDWATLQYDAALLVRVGLMPHPQPAHATRALRRAVERYDNWMLTALQSATAASGSLVVALALIERRLDAAEAFEVSQLDETFQIEQWGEDAEATKRRAALRDDIRAARRFADLLRAA